jgi:hypothetical protein
MEIRQVHEVKEKKKAHSNIAYQLESFIRDPFQSNTFY